MYTFVLVIHVIASLILVAVILLQAGKGGGLADTFGGGGAGTTIFGQKASAFLNKATTVSAVLFLCTSLLLAVISSKRSESLMETMKTLPKVEEAKQNITPQAKPAPEKVEPPKEQPDINK